MSRTHRPADFVIAALVAGMIATFPPSAQADSSSSRPVSPSVVATYLARNGELTLLVLWRGSPGWFWQGTGGNGSGGGGGASAGGHEYGSVSLSFGGRSFSIDFDYTDGTARLLDSTFSLADVNLVLVDDVDGPSGAHIVRRERVDPTLPDSSGPPTLQTDPVLTVIRRLPSLADFLQCDAMVPLPGSVDTMVTDPALRARLQEYTQNMIMLICREAAGR